MRRCAQARHRALVLTQLRRRSIPYVLLKYMGKPRDVMTIAQELD